MAQVRRSALVQPLLTAAIVLALSSVALATDPTEIKIGYLRISETKAAISFLDVPPRNDGIAGAKLAIEDNNTTGKFLNQRFLLEDFTIKETDDPVAAAVALAEKGILIVIADLPADSLLKAADAGREGMMIFNAGLD